MEKVSRCGSSDKHTRFSTASTKRMRARKRWFGVKEACQSFFGISCTADLPSLCSQAKGIVHNAHGNLLLC